MALNLTRAGATTILAVAMVTGTSRADTVVKPSTEYLKRIQLAEKFEPLGATPFGESISLYTGSLSFNQTDISYPGIGPTITLARRYEASGSPTSYLKDRPMADWDLSIPRIETLIPGRAAGRGGSWQVDGSAPNARCSQISPVANPFPYGLAWWHGYQMVSGDGNSQSLLLRGAANGLAPNNDVAQYKIVTQQHWMISCLPATANSAPGEAFLATSPDGTKYWFNHLVIGTAAETLAEHLRDQLDTARAKPNAALAAGRQPGDSGSDVYWGIDVLLMPRINAQMYATRVEDRFGNFLTYTYNNAGRLTEINASDGRKVAITWRSDMPLVDSITMQPGSAKARTWRYEYSNGSLSRVVQPDLSAWTLSMGNASLARVGSAFADGVCGIRFASQYSTSDINLSLTHPSGLVGQFALGQRMHGRARVPTYCPTGGEEPMSEIVPPLYLSLSLVRKTFSGPGLVASTWSYRYSDAYASTATECASGGQCRSSKWVEVTDPEGATGHHEFSTAWDSSEGKLLRSISAVSVTGQDNPTGLQTDSSTYALPTQGPYPVSLGSSLIDSNAPSNRQTMETLTPERLHKTVRQGVTFNREIISFDRFGQPLTVNRYSSLGSRSDTTEYWPVTSPWVVGLVYRETNTEVGETSRTDYDALARPIRTYGFNLLQQSLTYNPNGTIATVADGRGNTTKLENWRLGIPQLVTYADGSRIGAQVSDIGMVDWAYNELHVPISNESMSTYAYDAMGRLVLKTNPTGDTTAWADTSRNVASVNVAEYGIPAGHWKETIATGNGRTTTFYDALWRPVLTLAEDASALASRSFTVKRFDSAGKETFSSYPVASLTSVSSSIPGVTTEYDALGRVTRVKQDSELPGGLLVTQFDYLDGFATRKTNPRGFSTTTNFQAFDTPASDSPTVISLPESASTTIDRDVQGKPRSVSRSGAYQGLVEGATRRYVYDASQRLCKTINPESGATVVDYDAAGNVAWVAEGTSLTTTSCDRSLVLYGQKVFRKYDALNRVTLVETPGGTANLATTYYLDGQVKSFVASNPGTNPVTTSYSYNKRRLITAESSSNGSTLFTLGYGYNANGALATLTYPDNQTVSYAPDALGRATQVASGAGLAYATDIKYGPNGAISSFVYGNGIKHSMEPNARLLPKRSLDNYFVGTTQVKVLDDTYAFDANANVTDIVDQAQNGLTTRGMAYDGADRLTVAVSPLQWGNATYSYDALDNLRSADQGTRQYRYNYDTANRLANIKGPAGAAIFTFGYDSRGNTLSKNSQGYQFDSVNRMSQVTGLQTYRYDGQGRRVQTTDADGKTTFWIYSQSGQVLYTSEARRSQNVSYIYLGNTQLATRSVAWAGGAVNVRYQHTDALGSPVAETDPLRNIIKRNSYAPYGEAYGATVIDGTGYTGHVMDRATGLTYMQQRYYDPVLGRFLAVDPVMSNTNSGWNFNRYNYGANSPYSFTDPDGRSAVTKVVKLAKALAKGEDLAQTFADNVNDAQTLFNPLASPLEKAIAAASLASELLPVSVSDVKDVGRIAGVVSVAKGASDGLRAGKKHTPAANKLGRQKNRESNGGELVCPTCGKKMDEPVQSKLGEPINQDQAVGDHLIAKSKGGDGATVKDMANHETKCWLCNSRKKDD